MNYKHSKEVINFTCESDPTDIRIFINGTLHLFLRRSEIVSFQSWYVNKNNLKIEIYTNTRDILLEYNSVEKWKEILKLLNENI